MGASKTRVAYLLEIYSEGKASPEEEQELFTWVIKGNKKPVKEHIEKLVSSDHFGDAALEVDWERLYQQVLKETNARNIRPVVRKMTWIRWAAAAIVLLAGTGYYFFTAHKGNDQKELTSIEQIKMDDIAAPDAVNAVLTLDNGQRIILDSTGTGMLAVQGSVKVMKLPDGQISYRGTSKEIQYNTLSNPRGSKVIGLTLADGSKVWLNAASSLRYPTAFTGNERKVEITGEAYFEVAHDPVTPFIVSKDGTTVQVLGTHFNVNAYDDEHSLNVTLLEGSVSVGTIYSRQPKVIGPGEQAQVGKGGDIKLVNSVDTDEVMAWKNDLFSFKGAGIESIMRQVSRWYDVDVIFEKQVTEKFYAEVSRSTNVSMLLKMLEATRSVQFSIEGKTIRVTP
ncbi:MAG TPA: FecR domain-containing protein [Niabella sp.]|uniref:FecR family protein n=1 Tax=Agriterribacter sp. TaxID=2821509 RepID=UPI002C676C5F|nr:FecR domain-containing protein [Agriterribacter sp.]HRO85871.1 FecR domain-containing protein [Niabella sp.]HRP56248.1 FecR domain-containing protein [Agriterribacter sp.]